MEQHYLTCPEGEDLSSSRAVRLKARELLGCENNRIKLIEAMLLLILIVMSVVGITMALWLLIAPLLENYQTFYKNIYEISLLIDFCLMFFFALPVVLGMLTLAHRMCRGGAVAVDIFFAYRCLPRSWLVLLISSIPAALGTGICAGAYFLLSYFNSLSLISSSAGVKFLVYLCVLVVTGIIIIGALWLFGRGFFFAGYAMRGDMSVMQALATSFKVSRGRMREIWDFIFSFVGWAMLSIVTFGVLLVAHMAPYYMTSYMIYCSKVKRQRAAAHQID